MTTLYIALAFFFGFSAGGFLEYWADYTDWETLLKEEPALNTDAS
ncbi:MAG: hypothetical protein ABIK13_04280 [Patescibacteria group bacterium]